MLRWKIFRSKVTAVAWLVFISILFFLPASNLPKSNWLGEIYFDKWVHIGLFAALIFLWCSAFDLVRRYIWILLFSAALYGLGVEIIQGNYMMNRSFDLYDLLADIAGSLLGLFVWSWVYKK
jgi:VanZ family protein